MILSLDDSAIASGRQGEVEFRKITERGAPRSFPRFHLLIHTPMPNESAADYPKKLFYRINEVAKIAEVETYVLRYWESKFPMLAPEKDENDQRRYRQADIEMVFRIKELLYKDKFTIAGAVEKLQKESADRKRKGGAKGSAKKEIAKEPELAFDESGDGVPLSAEEDRPVEKEAEEAASAEEEAEEETEKAAVVKAAASRPRAEKNQEKDQNKASASASGPAPAELLEGVGAARSRIHKMISEAKSWRSNFRPQAPI